MHSLKLDGSVFRIKMDPFSFIMVDQLKTIPGSRYWMELDKTWSIPATVQGVEALENLMNHHTFDIEMDAMFFMQEIKEVTQKTDALTKASDSNVDETGINLPLHPFQRVCVAYGLCVKRYIIADEMGLGKTVEFLALLSASKAYPALVVCPSSLKLLWFRESSKWIRNVSIRIVDGNVTPSQVEGIKIVITSYDVLGRDYNAGDLVKRTFTPKSGGMIDVLQNVGFKTLCADESHYLKNNKAARTRAVKFLSGGFEYRVLMSGTPILNRPSEIISQLEVIDRLQDLGGFWKFVHRYCGAYSGTYSLDIKGASNLGELNDLLRKTCYIRRTKEEVLPELPPKQRSYVPVEITNRKDYESAESDFIRWLMENEPEKASSAYRAKEMVKMNYLRMMCAKGKMEAMNQWIKEFETEKLIFFAHHKVIQNEIRSLNKGSLRIHGDDNVTIRQGYVDKFQSDPDSHLIVCSLEVGGLGHTLTASSNVAFGEFPWTPAKIDQAEDRAHRIGQNDSVNVYYLYARDTIDEDFIGTLDAKRKVIDEMIDGKEISSGKSLLMETINAMLRRVS